MLNIEYFLLGLASLIFLGYFIINALKTSELTRTIIISIVLGIILVVTWGIAFFGKPLHMQIEELQDFIISLNPLHPLVEKAAWEFYYFLLGIVVGFILVLVVIMTQVKKFREKRKKRYW